MSIAADEAEKYFPTQYWPHMEPNVDYRGKECYIEGVKSSDIQEAYEQGRTAEPTEAEIDAAAVSLAEILNSLSLGNEKYSGITVGQVVRELFAAARKAVTE